jgi:hypothetical protein
MMMRLLFTLFFLSLSLLINAQDPLVNQSFISIDHVPVAVKNLDSIKNYLATVLYFKIKEGKKHSGIKNFFLKFEDGTYLEFTTPVNNQQAIGKYYTDFLKQRQGAAALAIAVTDAAIIAHSLRTKAIPFEKDSNAIWKTVAPHNANLFFIDYTDKSWKDTKQYTAHPNKALLLKATYSIVANVDAEVDIYRKLGFTQIANASCWGIPCMQIVVGKSRLYLLDASKATSLTTQLGNRHLTGIGGVEIKVRSLAALNTLLANIPGVVIAPASTTCFLKACNFFINFTE